MTNNDLVTQLTGRLPTRATGWLRQATDRIRADPPAIDVIFPVVGRCCGRGPVPGADDALRGWTIDDAVRTLLLDCLPLTGPDLRDVFFRLYRNGDAAERRGVLRALTVLDRDGHLGTAAVPLVEDAVRTNDARLIGAALGGYAARHLDAAAFRQAVLKCVFVGIPLADVAGLAERPDAELVRMLADYARERVAAGRDVPPDVRLVGLAAIAPATDPTGVLSSRD